MARGLQPAFYDPDAAALLKRRVLDFYGTL
jgi:hypothetical protein